MKQRVAFVLVAVVAAIDLLYVRAQWRNDRPVFAVLALIALLVVLVAAAVTRLGAKPLVTRPTK